MASSESEPRAVAAAESRGNLQVSAYERVASMLVTLLLLIGFVVGIMALLFITMQIVASHHAVPMDFLDDLESDAMMDTGGGEDFEEPGLEEMQELPEPQLDNMMKAVSDAVTAEPRALDALDGDSDMTGRGDGRGRGPKGPDVIPFGRRTRIQYGETSLDEYGAILDYFGIELGAAGGGQNKVDYASNFSQATPDTRSGSPQDEGRIYLIWRRGSKLKDADRRLLARAKVKTAGREIMQFLPKPVEQTLRILEKREAGGRDPSMLQMTVYEVQKKGAQYEFGVLDQQLRTPR